MIKLPFLAFLSLVALSRANEGALTGVDPDLIDKPSNNIDFPGCFQDLVTADRNGDGLIRQKEYLGFIQEYGKNRRCFDTDALTLEQNAAFNSLACICRSQEGKAPDCCLGSNAQIVTAGALPPSTRTEEQLQYLTAVCIVTDGTITGQCPPKIRERETPPPIIIIPANGASGGGGLSDGAKWAIIAAAIAAALLLLLLCCCCCVLRRKRAKALEEEEEEGYGGKPGEDVETAPEQYPGDSDRDLPAAAAAIPPGSDDDSSYEGEGRKSRGQNFAEDEDDETRRRLRGEGELPPDNNPRETVQLRPPPPKEPEEDPDWDYPGREINEPKPDPDEYSAGEYEHYEPDGGVHIPEHPPRDPVEPYKNKWERLKKEEPDEVDMRKHRIQSGLGEGEVWDKLGENEEPDPSSKAPEGDVFDWVVQSALGVLDKSDEAGHLDDEGSTTVP